MARYVLAILAAVLLAASAEATTRQLLQAPDAAACQKKVEEAGGQSTIQSLLKGACEGKGTTVDELVKSDCCSTVQAIAQQAGGCECNKDVWNAVQNTAVSSGISGINAGTLSEFMDKCTKAKGFKVYGHGC